MLTLQSDDTVRRRIDKPKIAVCLKDIVIRKQAFCLSNKGNKEIKISQSEIRKRNTSEPGNKRIFS